MQGKAILCIIGALLINLTLGTFYSISNVFSYVASYMHNNGNPGVVAENSPYITASFLFGQGLFMLLGAYIERKFNSRIACIFGCIIHCASTFATIWALKKNLLAVVLIYGLGSGLGCGSSYMASIIAAQKWFPQNKGVFTGIIVAGFGFGGLIFTSLQTLYVNPYNKGYDTATGYYEQSVYERVPNLFLYMGLVFTVTQAIGCTLSFPAPEIQSSHDANQETGASVVTLIDGDPVPEPKTFGAVFKNRLLYIIGAMMMLVAPGVTLVSSLGKRYGQSYLIGEDRFLATTVSVAAVANALGRLTWGFMMDRFTFSTCYTVKVLMFAMLIMLFPFSFILSSKSLYMVWMLGLYFSFSGTFVLFPVFIEQVFGVKYHGIIYGMNYIFLALSSILTSFIIQFTITKGSKKENPDDKLTSRVVTCTTVAILYLVSLALYMSAVPVRKLEMGIKKKIAENQAKTKNSLAHRQDLYPLERSSLADRTAKSENGLQKENSLGSIVRIRDNIEDKGIKTLGKAYNKP